MVVEVLAPHPAVDRGAPVAAVPGGTAVVDVEHRVAARGEQVVEHVLARVRGPPVMDVVQVSGTVHEDHAGAVGLRAVRLRPVEARGDRCAVLAGDHHDRRHLPRVGAELLGGRSREPIHPWLFGRGEVEFRGRVRRRVHRRDRRAVRRDHWRVPAVAARDASAAAPVERHPVRLAGVGRRLARDEMEHPGLARGVHAEHLPRTARERLFPRAVGEHGVEMRVARLLGDEPGATVRCPPVASVARAVHPRFVAERIHDGRCAAGRGDGPEVAVLEVGARDPEEREPPVVAPVTHAGSAGRLLVRCQVEPGDLARGDVEVAHFRRPLRVPDLRPAGDHPRVPLGGDVVRDIRTLRPSGRGGGGDDRALPVRGDGDRPDALRLRDPDDGKRARLGRATALARDGVRAELVAHDLEKLLLLLREGRTLAAWGLGLARRSPAPDVSELPGEAARERHRVDVVLPHEVHLALVEREARLALEGVGLRESPVHDRRPTVLAEPQVAPGGDDLRASVAGTYPAGEQWRDRVHVRIGHPLRRGAGARLHPVGFERGIPGGPRRQPPEVDPAAVRRESHLRWFATVELGATHDVLHREVERGLLRTRAGNGRGGQEDKEGESGKCWTSHRRIGLEGRARAMCRAQWGARNLRGDAGAADTVQARRGNRA